MATTNWITLDPDGADVQNFLAVSVWNAVNQKNAAGISRLSGQNGIVQTVVDRIRSAILTGNRTPLSLTANSLPPEARGYAMALIVFVLVDSQPQMGEFVLKDGATRRWEDAEKWVRAVSEGKPVTKPTDPDPDHTPSGPEWGDVGGTETNNTSSAKVDLTTD